MASEKLSVVIGVPPSIWNIFDEEARARLLNSHPNVTMEAETDPERFAEKVLQADGAMAFNYQIPKEALKQGSRLRWVHSIPAGVDKLLTPELVAAEHVAITASKGPHAPLIAEHMVLLMLSLARDMPTLVKDQEKHRWSRDDERGGVPRLSTQMLGKTIAILGVGQIGDNFARMCKVGFGMKVLGMSRTSRDSKHIDRYFDRSNCMTRWEKPMW